jgi:glycosyltransferase involved in cell wall biosynthesis
MLEWFNRKELIMADLSVIVPYVNEYPQLVFTLQSINQELHGRVDFEVIAVNNYCDEVIKQDRDTVRRLTRRLKVFYNLDVPDEEIIGVLEEDETGLIGKEDKGGDVLSACAPGNKWLIPLEYKDKLSHWNAKRIGVEKATGRYFIFIDAHCSVGRDSIYPMYECYRNHVENHGEYADGTMHLPLTYKILEWHRIIYALRFVRTEDQAQLDYRFTNYRQPKDGAPFEVPCMSTCGMLMTRELYEEVGGWPSELGIYSGGEHFMNFTLAVLGKKKYIYPTKTALYHHGEKRGYAFHSGDTLRNRLLATYLYGGKGWLEENAKKARGRPDVKLRIVDEILSSNSLNKHRAHIKSKQKMDIFEWLNKWGY